MLAKTAQRLGDVAGDGWLFSNDQSFTHISILRLLQRAVLLWQPLVVYRLSAKLLKLGLKSKWNVDGVQLKRLGTRPFREGRERGISSGSAGVGLAKVSYAALDGGGLKQRSRRGKEADYLRQLAHFFSEFGV